MGMYDTIVAELPCQGCGEVIGDFQSKDGPCALLKLTPEQLFEEAGAGADFYTPCPHCRHWNEWTFAPPAAMQIVASPSPRFPPKFPAP